VLISKLFVSGWSTLLPLSVSLSHFVLTSLGSQDLQSQAFRSIHHSSLKVKEVNLLLLGKSDSNLNLAGSVLVSGREQLLL
jgi:hypothetical protein